jgi:hypothetical protein
MVWSSSRTQRRHSRCVCVALFQEIVFFFLFAILSSSSSLLSAAPAAALLLSSAEWHALVLRLLDTLMAAAGADDFSIVVDPVAFGVPDYWAYVHRPMDLGTVRANVVKGAYSAPWQVAEVCSRRRRRRSRSGLRRPRR